MISILVSYGSSLNVRPPSFYSRWFGIILKIEKFRNDIYRIELHDQAEHVTEGTEWTMRRQVLVPNGYSMRYQFNKSKQVFQIHSIQVDRR